MSNPSLLGLVISGGYSAAWEPADNADTESHFLVAGYPNGRHRTGRCAPVPPRSARLASSTTRPVLIRPGHGSGSSMPLPIPCVRAAWYLSPAWGREHRSFRSSSERSRSGCSEPPLSLSSRWVRCRRPLHGQRRAKGRGGQARRGFEPRQGALRCGGEPLIGGAERPGSCVARAMVPFALLVHPHHWQGGQCTRIEPQRVEHCEISCDELAEFCGCPVGALRFSRVVPLPTGMAMRTVCKPLLALILLDKSVA